MLIKHLPDQDEMYVAHNTWHEYTAMSYKALKKYNLPFRRLAGNEERVAAETATMSSYVGTIFSLDDFMTLSSGLVTTETSLFIYDSTLFEASQPLGQVFEPARVMAANRLARDGREWTEIASQFNSGTYNNQWMVVDMSKVLEGRLDDGALWVMEQLPGRYCKKHSHPKSCLNVLHSRVTYQIHVPGHGQKIKRQCCVVLATGRPTTEPSIRKSLSKVEPQN